MRDDITLDNNNVVSVESDSQQLFSPGGPPRLSFL
jgi:hypothetical protein